MDDGLAAAVSAAYRVFSNYTFGAGLPAGSADGGLGPLEERLLRLTPVNEIPPELLAAHSASLAPTMAGPADHDLRALLPRYFELIVAGGFPLHGWRQDALLALARVDFRSRWPVEEAQAIDRILAGLLEAAEAGGGPGDLTVIRGLIPAVPGPAEAVSLHRDAAGGLQGPAVERG